MKRFTIFLTEDQAQRLTAIAKGRTISELIREAIAHYLDKREREAQR